MIQKLKLEIVQIKRLGHRGWCWGILETRGEDYRLMPIDHYLRHRCLTLVEVREGRTVSCHGNLTWEHPTHKPNVRAVNALNAAMIEHHEELTRSPTCRNCDAPVTDEREVCGDCQALVDAAFAK